MQFLKLNAHETAIKTITLFNERELPVQPNQVVKIVAA
jgi:hypothetical protein